MLSSGFYEKKSMTNPHFNSQSEKAQVRSAVKKYRNWGLLLLVSSVFVTGLESVHAPAAFLLGPMLAAIIVVISNLPMVLNPLAFRTAQVIVGLMMASHLPLSTFDNIAQQWPVFIFGTVMTVIASGLVGVALSKSGLLPGTTAIWGTSPGAAGVMTIMSESYGADMRLVAVMQYTRVAFCAFAAMLTASLLVDSQTLQNVEVQWFVDSWSNFFITLLVVIVSLWVSSKVRVSGGFLLLPMFIGFVLQSFDVVVIELPAFLLMIAFAVMGWGIGFRFTPAVVRHAIKVFPFILLSILFLLLVNALLAWFLVWWIGIDFLSAFLGTSPGGADSVAIIASNIPVDTGFVMTMQVSRFLLVMIVGPLLAKWLSTKLIGQQE